MTWINGIWVVAGVMLGMVHGMGLWHSAKHPTAMTAILGSVRLLIIGILLAVAAIYGGILPAAGGWAFGFFASVAAALTLRGRSMKRGAVP